MFWYACIKNKFLKIKYIFLNKKYLKRNQYLTLIKLIFMIMSNNFKKILI